MKDELGTLKNLVDGFLPSIYGLKYSNVWPHVPYVELAIIGAKKIGIGDASNGVCGGMVYAARDLFERKMLAPPETTAPHADSNAFKFLLRRSLQSFDLPKGVLDYYGWMNLASQDTMLFAGLLLRGTSWRTVHQSMPAIKRVIDSGHPCPLGLVCTHSPDPFKLKLNHQVLAWGYEITDTMTTIKVYDPNHPCDDTITVSFNHIGINGTTDFQGLMGEHTIFGFFPTTYSLVDCQPLFE